MLATFVIGLREGLEAALIVGIIAAFLRQSGRADALPRMWFGVGGAVLICLAIGVGLELFNTGLPQRQQEMLESLVAAVAVVMVTYMVLWMRRNSRDLRSQLQASAGGALATGSATALIVMAFLAVFREGFETAVFLLAAFQNTGSPVRAGAGALLGIAVALVLGFLLYRGGVRLNLSRFFRATGVVLVLVAAGLVMSALRAAHEAGWLEVGQQTALTVGGLARSGTVQESLLTGMLGIHAAVPVVELLAWLLYLVPMLAVVLWPPRRVPAPRTRFRLLTSVGAGAVLTALLLTVLRPSSPTPPGLAGDLTGVVSAGTDAATGADLTGSAVTGQAAAELSGDRSTVQLRVDVDGTAVDAAVPVELSGHATVAGHGVAVYRGAAVTLAPTGLPTTLSRAQVADLNGGRLPVGAGGAGRGDFAAVFADAVVPTVSVDPDSGAVLAITVDLGRSLTLTPPGGGASFSAGRVLQAALTSTSDVTAAQVRAADRYRSDVARAQVWGAVVPALLAGWGLILIVVGLGVAGRGRRGPAGPPTVRPASTVPAGAAVVAPGESPPGSAVARPEPPLVAAGSRPPD